MTTGRLIIRGGWVATMDSRLGDMPSADLLIENGRIAAVGANLQAQDAEELDATHHLVLPGMIDTHRHTWETVLRGVGVDWLQGHYFEGVHRSARHALRAEHVRASTLAGALDALEGGTTTLVDWSHISETPDHTDAAIDALHDSGIRAVFGYGGASEQWHDLPNDVPLTQSEVRRVRRELLPSDDASVTMLLAARGPEFSSERAVIADWQLASELGLHVSLHAGAGLKAIRASPVKALDRWGLLRPGTTFVHGNFLDDSDLARIAGTGGSLSLVPEVDLMMGMGPLPTDRARQHEVTLSISTDEVASGSGSMLTALRCMLASERGRASAAALIVEESPSVVTLTAREALEIATMGGARALGRQDELGSLTPGKRADMILVDLTSRRLSPANDPVDQFVAAAESSDITTVIIDGSVVKHKGALTRGDHDRVRNDLNRARDEVFAALGRTPGHRWLPRDLAGPQWFADLGERERPA